MIITFIQIIILHKVLGSGKFHSLVEQIFEDFWFVVELDTGFQSIAYRLCRTIDKSR